MMITRDYKRVGDKDAAVPRVPPYKRGLSFLSGLSLGLLLGLVSVVSVHFYHVGQRGSAAPPATAANEPATTDEHNQGPHDYDFFRILTQMEVVVPEYEEVDAASRPSYILQAGSFRAQRTAEFLQEKLKALNLESEVQAVEVDDGSVWYRVRLGPYDNLSRVNNIRLNLRKQGIESMLKKR